MHCARTAQFTRFGSPCADVLVLHPLETAYTILNEKLPDRIDDTEIDRFDSWFYRLMSNLKSAHIDFELGDFATVRDMGEITDDGFFKVSKMTYKTVVLPRIDVLNWQNNIDTDTDTWTSSYNILPLGFDGAEIVLCY